MKVTVLLFASALISSALFGQVPGTGDAVASDTGSEAGTPQALLADSNAAVDAMNDRYIKVWRTLMAPKNVADAFGRRIAERYIALQITIANRNSEYQWLIQDASVDLHPLLVHLQSAVGEQPRCRQNLDLLLRRIRELGVPESDSGERSRLIKGEDEYLLRSNPQVSSADLTVLRGVSEKGQVYDPRNLSLRILTMAGTIASGLLGVTTFGPSFAPSIAAFNGPVVGSLDRAFPDFTTNQLNRLNDSAFLANTIVEKQHARVIVIFIPMEYLLTREQAKDFYENPESVFGCPDLRLLEAWIDGNFITTLLPTPVITTVAIDANEAADFARDNFAVAGALIGRFLERASVELLNPPEGITIEASGEATDNRLPFVIEGVKPLMPGQLLEFQVEVEGVEPVKSAYTVLYSPQRPTLEPGALTPGTAASGAATTVTVKGTNFLPDADMEVLVEPAAGISIGPIEYVSNTELRVEITVAAGVAAGPRQVRISSKGGTTNPPTTLTIQ